MRKLFFTFSMILCLAFSSAQQEDFAKANELYNSGNYLEAIATYESILSTKMHSAEVYYNLANAYYKTNQVAPSIFYYEKALQLAPNDSDIKNNLAFAQNMTIDAIETLPKVGFAKITNSYLSWLTFDGWAILAVVLIVVFVVTFLAYYFSYSTTKKRLFFITSVISIVLAMVSVVTAYQAYNFEVTDKPAIVFADEIEVKTDPNLKSDTVFKLHEGTKVNVLESFDENWSKVRIADGREGWLDNAEIKLLNNF